MIERNQKRIAYHKWIAERHPIGEVVLLEFVKQAGKISRKGKIYPVKHKGKLYLGETWLCKLIKSGKEVYCTFPMEVGEYSEETSYITNTEPIDDYNEVNLLQDEYEEYLQGYIDEEKYPNKSLLRFEKKMDNYINFLNEMLENTLPKERVLREGLFLIIRQLENPTLIGFKTKQHWIEKNTECFKQITINQKNQILLSMT